MEGTWNIRSHVEALERYGLLQEGDDRALSRNDVIAMADKLDSEWLKLQNHCRSLERTLRKMNIDRMDKCARMRREIDKIRNESHSNVGQALAELTKEMLMRYHSPERTYIQEYVSPSGSREWRVIYAKPETK